MRAVCLVEVEWGMTGEKKVLLRDVRSGEVKEVPVEEFEKKYKTKPWPTMKKAQGYIDVWCDWRDGSHYTDGWAETTKP
jgi:hypothetical protein